MELTEFLRVQFAKDQAAIEAWMAACVHLEACGPTDLFTDRFDLDGQRWADDLAAKRRILESEQDRVVEEGPLPERMRSAVETEALRLLAQPYAGQPGYRDEWRPA
jgi:hypothetical protein